LCRHLDHPSQGLTQNCLFTLRNLSDAASNMENMNEILYNCMRLLGSSNVQIVSTSAGVLSNLTAYNPKNKVQLIFA
jgi:hypothetical protein